MWRDEKKGRKKGREDERKSTGSRVHSSSQWGKKANRLWSEAETDTGRRADRWKEREDEGNSTRSRVNSSNSTATSANARCFYLNVKKARTRMMAVFLIFLSLSPLLLRILLLLLIIIIMFFLSSSYRCALISIGIAVFLIVQFGLLIKKSISGLNEGKRERQTEQTQTKRGETGERRDREAKEGKRGREKCFS